MTDKTTTLEQESMEQEKTAAAGEGGYLTLAIATAALVVASFAGYKVWVPGASTAAACYRTIDMANLTKFLLNDMMEKTANTAVDAADASYRTRLNALDTEVGKHAGGCLLVRRDAVVLPDPSIDITSQVARAVGLDLSQPATRKPVASVSPIPAPVSASSNAPGSKLD